MENLKMKQHTGWKIQISKVSNITLINKIQLIKINFYLDCILYIHKSLSSNGNLDKNYLKRWSWQRIDHRNGRNVK